MEAYKGCLAELKVLVIDDTYESRSLLKDMLTDIGVHQVFEASGGQEGMQFIDSAFDFVDIILCDWNMPEIDGMTLLRHLRTFDASFPFMMVTGRGDVVSVSQAKKAGVSGYILKPYSQAQLEAKLRIVASRVEKLSV